MRCLLRNLIEQEGDCSRYFEFKQKHMAAKKTRRPKITFELSRSGIGGIAVVCFCLFLWMFLFGVWAGQSLLRPISPVAAEFDAGSVVQPEQPVILEEQKKRKPQ